MEIDPAVLFRLLHEMEVVHTARIQGADQGNRQISISVPFAVCIMTTTWYDAAHPHQRCRSFHHASIFLKQPSNGGRFDRGIRGSIGDMGAVLDHCESWVDDHTRRIH